MVEIQNTGSHQHGKTVVHRANKWDGKPEIKYVSVGYALNREGQSFSLRRLTESDTIDGFRYVAVFLRTNSNDLYCILIENSEVRLSHANDRTVTRLLHHENLEIIVGKPFKYRNDAKPTSPISEIVTFTDKRHKYRCSNGKGSYNNFLREIDATETKIIAEFDSIWHYGRHMRR